jgi:hypothetical protein
MPIRVQLVFEDDGGGPAVVQEVAQLTRDVLSPETLGLTLAEAKTVLHSLQVHLTRQQVSTYQQQQLPCPDCQQLRRVKDSRKLVYHSLFGKLNLHTTRLFQCGCQPHEKKSISPLSDLLSERTTPELLYLESKFAALMSYGQSAKLLAEVLPIDEHLSAATVRNHTQQVAERLEAELGDEQFMFVEGCERDWEALPRPDMPLTMGIDGGYVRASKSQDADSKQRCFEVITGKSIADDGSSKCFGLVNSYDEKPKRRVFEVLKSQGMQMNQQITFFSDGGDTVRDLQLYLNPQAEHLLDWFHITMRITAMNQMAKGVSYHEDWQQEDVLKTLESIKWYLWHGNVFRTLQEIESLTLTLDTDETSPEQLRLLKKAEEFETYITNNQPFITNYGERYRNGERIATGFVESTVNQVISKRMVKKQQMRWTPKGAHLLLQVRTRVLDDDLRKTFERWYPGLEAQAA